MSELDLDIEFRNRLKFIADQFRDKELPAYATFIDGNGYYVAKVTSVNIIPPDAEIYYWWTEGTYDIVGGDQLGYKHVKNDYSMDKVGFQNFLSFVDPNEMKQKCFWFE